MGEFLSFRKFITPLVIQAFFWVWVVITVIAALVMMFQGTVGSFLSGFVVLIVGPIVVRIYCELLILLFRIYDELVAMRTGVPPAGTAVQAGFPVYTSNPAPPGMPPAAPPPHGG